MPILYSMCKIERSYTHGGMMRTNIVIDDQLMNEVIKLTGAKTKKEAVELGLLTLIRIKKQEKIRQYRGKLDWDSNLDDMRTD